MYDFLTIKMSSASVIAFSSSANLGPGYDVLAVSHNAFFDRVKVESDSSMGAGRIRIISDKTPQTVEKNTAGLALLNMFNELQINEKVKVTIEKGIPFGLGLGSSGASSAAAVFAANSLLKLSLSSEEMVRYAMHGEVASSGTPHADNVAASLSGGLVVVSAVSPVRIRHISIHERFSFLTIMPHIYIENKTMRAREMVPHQISIEDSIQNTRFLSSLVAGMITGDKNLLIEGMNDCIVEPARNPIFPFYEELKKIALRNGAAGVSVSGAGPSVLVVCDETTVKSKIASDSERLIQSYGHKCSIVDSTPSSGAFNETVDAYGQ